MSREVAFRSADGRDWGLVPRAQGSPVGCRLKNGLAEVWFRVNLRKQVRALRRASIEATPFRLSIGSGRTVPAGWYGIDLKRGDRIFNLDLERPIPLPDGSVDGILCEHVLEHFHFDDLRLMLRDYHRLLRNDAPIRIVCPDAEVVAKLVLRLDDARVLAQLDLEARIHRWDDDEWLRHKAVNRLTYQFGQHKALLDAESTKLLLHEAGFRNTIVVEPFTSRYFEDVPTTHFTRFPDSVHEAFVVEATK